ETYVELTPGDPEGRKLNDGGTLPNGQVSEAVQLDEIFRTFNSETRFAFQGWMQNVAIALRGQGESLSNAFGELEPTFTDADRVLRILDTQDNAVQQLLANGATTFEALSERRGQLSGLIQNADRVFTTTARRNRELAETFVAFPTFLDQSRATLTRLERFAQNTDPLMRQLRPAVRELTPVVRDLGEGARELDGFFIGLRPVVAGARRAFPALRRLLLADFPVLLNGLPPFLKQANPLLETASLYKRELVSFFANGSSVTNAVGAGVETNNEPVRYLRTVAPLDVSSLAGFSNRLSNNRTNPYLQPGGYSNLAAGGLQSFETAQCAGGPLRTTSLDPSTPSNPDFNARTGGNVADAQDFFDRLRTYAFNGNLSSDAIGNVGCVKQAPFNPLGQGGAATDYLHVFAQP
ncbi:MAG: MlaD family protein, partial [Acidimicrobiales bacterium]